MWDLDRVAFMEQYVPRLVDKLLERRIQHHPALLITGPRASGKTTTAARLARSVVSLDQPAFASAVRGDADAAIRGLEEPILIDEWHIVPEVLGAVKRSVDKDPRPGRFIVTGSVRGDIDSPTWPGTGRLLRVSMFGLTMSEIRRHIPSVPLLDRLAAGELESLLTAPQHVLDLRDYAEICLRSGFPDPALRLPPEERGPWLESYLEHLFTRDLEELAPRRNPQIAQRFLEAHALNTAGIVDQQTLHTLTGVAKTTGQAYEQLLRNLLIVDAIPAWWSSRVKRLIRSPKRYVVDSALALAALRMDIRGLMSDGNMLGRVLDTLVVAQLRSTIPCCTSAPRLFHLRQEEGRHEIDIVVEYGGGRIFGIEIKATSAPKHEDARHLVWLREELGDRFLGGMVLHTGPRAFLLGEKIVAAPISSTWS